MYGGKSQLLIENPISRYLINWPMLPAMKKNSDGSLTIYIQKDIPSADKKSNWLPAPNDTIYLVLRLYWPKETPPSILPTGTGTWQPPAVVQTNWQDTRVRRTLQFLERSSLRNSWLADNGALRRHWCQETNTLRVCFLESCVRLWAPTFHGMDGKLSEKIALG